MRSGTQSRRGAVPRQLSYRYLFGLTFRHRQVSGGSGTLTFKGKEYPISIGGVSLGATIGASKAEFVGDVFNLSSAGDIEGIYSGAKAGIALAGGEKVAELKSSKDVVLKVSGKQMGLELTLDLNGMQISLKK